MTTESSYPVIGAKLDLRGEQFKANKTGWDSVMVKFENALREVAVEGNEVSLLRHQRRGQLLRMLSPVL